MIALEEEGQHGDGGGGLAKEKVKRAGKRVSEIYREGKWNLLRNEG